MYKIYLCVGIFILNLGCSNRIPTRSWDKFIIMNNDSIKISIPYLEFSKIAYNEDLDPYMVCLRDMYAIGKGDIDLHLEHTDFRTLYQRDPGTSFDSIDDNKLKAGIKSFYHPNGKKETIKLEGNLVKECVQIFDKERNHCEVIFYYDNNKYVLERKKQLWKIVDL